jgi:hypothetical protein
MAENIKLKDLYDEEQTYSGIDTVKIPKADGSGDATFVVPPTSMYMLKKSSYSGTEESSAYAYSGVESDITAFGNNVQKELYPNALPIPTVHNYTFGENNIYCHPLESVTITELMNRMLRVFSDDNVTVTPNTYSVTPGWFHIKYTKTGEGANIQVTITEFEEVADPSTVTFPAYLPWTINDANYFYAYIAEATQQIKAVTVTENGTQIINPDAGKSGLAAVKLTVNVPTASVGAYYLLKDPLGDMPTYEGGIMIYDSGTPLWVINLNASSASGYVNTSLFTYQIKEGWTSIASTSFVWFWYTTEAETITETVLASLAGEWLFGDVTLAKGWNITTFSASGGNISANTVATTIDEVNEQLSSYGGIPENNFDDWSTIDSYTLSFFKKVGLFGLQQEKSVAVSSNGNIEVLPDAGYDGMSKVNLQVDIAGGNLQEKQVVATADGIAPNSALYFGENGAIDVRPDAGYDGVSYAQVVVKGKMLGQDDISVINVSHHAVTFDLKNKAGYIGYAQGSTLDANCYFGRLQNKKTGGEVLNAEITENGVYDIITQMSATNVPSPPAGALASFSVNVASPPAPTLSVFQIQEVMDTANYGKKKIIPENCVFTAADWLNQELNGKTIGYWLVKNNVQWNPTGVLNEDGSVAVNLGDWMKLSPTKPETVTGMVDEEGNVTIALGQLYPKPSVSDVSKLNGVIDEDGTVGFPWIYYKTGTAQMLPIETTT